MCNLKKVQSIIRRRKIAFASYLFNHLSILLIILVLISGCSSTQSAIKPVYPILDDNTKKSVLILENKNVVFSFFDVQEKPNLYVEIDGFLPTSKETLPVGITKIDIPAGTHEIIHKGVSGSKRLLDIVGSRNMNPISTHFRTEEGKTYTISFDYYKEKLTRIGYKIQYKGWTEEEMAQWPEENMINLL